MDIAGSNNGLVNALPRKHRDRLLRACEPFELVFGEVLSGAGKPYRHAYFPDSGQISLSSSARGHKPLEMAIVGHEGMLGATVVLGINVSPMHAVVQGPGMAGQIPVASLQRELRASPSLRKLLNRYLYLQLVELSLTSVCTRFHQIEERLARWLLLTHDRAQSDHFHLTHEHLADMLGVRRSGITVAAGELQARNLIQYSRGDITVLDRRGLEAASCDCYAALNGRHKRLLGAPSHRSGPS
jgi:CRP-like cAMP-binding protein